MSAPLAVGRRVATELEQAGLIRFWDAMRERLQDFALSLHPRLRPDDARVSNPMFQKTNQTFLTDFVEKAPDIGV